MPVFTFSGKTASGEKVQGERVAPTKDGLAAALRKERITPGSIREKGKEFSLPTFGSSKINVKEVVADGSKSPFYLQPLDTVYVE